MPEIQPGKAIPTSIRDERFSPARCADYCLSLQIEPKSVTVAVFDNIQGNYLALEKHDFPNCNDFSALLPRLEKLVDAHEWLHNRFKRTDAMLITERSTLVPVALFDQSRSLEYLGFNHPVSENEEVKNDLLRNLDARNLWLISSDFEKALKKLFPGVRLCHYSTPLIESLLLSNKNEPQKRVFAHVQEDHFEVVVLEGRKLHLYNTFRFQSGEDFLFYLLFVCEQLKLSPETADLVLLGETAADSSIAGLAKKYVRQVRFGERPVQAGFGKAFDVLPGYYYYNLFSLHYFS
ncbi:MAG: hypothetical protein FD123_661 [Bacteroidetes bacterium]|nr:MAG: hypothetical protein FD123_661 [Bacteroidota bacterium]